MCAILNPNTPPSPTEVIPTDKVEVGFKDLDAAILVGSMPRKEGMERKDLLKANVAIFKTQGTALEKYAKKTVKVTVCLTDCRRLRMNAEAAVCDCSLLGCSQYGCVRERGSERERGAVCVY